MNKQGHAHFTPHQLPAAALLWTALLTGFLAVMTCQAAEDTPPLPQKPDLDVTYISQRPLYPGYWLEYPDDVPTFWVPDPSSPDGSRVVTKEEYMRLRKYQPAEGEEVTFTAHVRNNGFVSAPETDYRLYIDGRAVGKGKIKALEVGEEATVAYKWNYKEGRHTISCEVDIEDRVEEICEINNRLTDPTWGIGLTIRAWNEANYKAFRSTPNMWGSYSFEDWCQAHIQEWRKAFRQAVYPATPQGILQGIRFDGIFTEANDPALLEYRRKDIPDILKRLGRPYDTFPESARDWLENEGCSWRINWKLDDIPNYAKKIDRGLIHELCHQCGIIDLYQIGMHTSSNLVTGPDGHFLWVAVGCYNQFSDLMAVYGENPDALPQRGIFREHTAAAFNSEIDKPRGGFGLYLFDLPEHNVLKVMDNRGNPIQGAKIKLYQQEIETRTVGKIPPKAGITDENGEWDMGPHPIDKIHVVATNAVMLFEINAYDQWEYHCLVITEMNVAYWRGDKERHVYAMETGIAPPASVPAPRDLALEVLALKQGRLRWDYPDDVRNVQKFVVMRREGHLGTAYKPAFQEIVAEVWGNERSVDVEIDARPTKFFTVVAVDQMGDRSGYSNVVVYPDDDVMPHLGRTWGVIQAPDGSIYTINSDYATILGLNPKGGRLNLADTIKFEAPEIVACIAADKKGILYVPNYKGGYIYRVDPLKAKPLENLACPALEEPRGIALGPDEHFYVSDIGQNQVHVITKEGRLLASFGGPEVFECARNVHVDGNGLVYVVDCPKGGNVGTSPGKVHVFRKSAPDKWEFEPALTIEGINWVECVITDEAGRIYVGCHDGIHVFDADGQRLAHWRSKPYGNLSGGTIVAGMAWDKNDGDLLVTQGFTVRQLIRVTVTEILGGK